MRGLIVSGSTLIGAALLAVSAVGAPLDFEVVSLDRLPGPSETAKSERRPDMLPDGVIARGTGTIRAAWLTGPTRRYTHGVLGDDIEASGISIELETGEVLSVVLGPDAVFEDRVPRLVDLTADGRDEVLVVKSYQTTGATLSLIAEVDGRLSIIAEGDPVGQPYRWLNPVGVGDFDGDGRVETPHIGGTLVLSRLERGRLVSIQRIGGFSNHRMGSRELGLSAVLDANGDGVPDLAVPDNSRTSLRVVTFAGGSFRELARIDFGAEITSSLRPTEIGADKRMGLAFRLSDGRVVGLVFAR